MSKKWFEEWHIQLQHNEDGEAEIFIDLVNTKNEKPHFYLKLKDTKKADELFSILTAAFDQIQRDNGGYKTDIKRSIDKRT